MGETWKWDHQSNTWYWGTDKNGIGVYQYELNFDMWCSNVVVGGDIHYYEFGNKSREKAMEESIKEYYRIRKELYE